MSKRKSMNKRLSRFSRSSRGSAVLDPDTNILDAEYPYWWKNLENNTIARPSVGSDVLNQTSRNLSSNSQIETSQVADEWWKALDSSNTPYSTKKNMKNEDKDSSSNISTSESGEEHEVVKKKLQFRLNARSTKDNAFLNVLNDSVATTTANIVPSAKTKNSVNDAAPNNRTFTNFEHLDKVQKNSLNQSQGTSDALKSKPEIFKKDYKIQGRNAFVDVLTNWVPSKSPRRMSSEASINNESRIITSMAVPENLNATESRRYQLSLSLETETSLSRLPAPKAQSTLREDSTSSVQDSNKSSLASDIEYEIRKPKAKLITHRCKNTEENLFENVLQCQGITDKVDNGDVIRQDDVAVGTVPEESLKQLMDARVTARRTINKHKDDHVVDISAQSLDKSSTRVAELALDKRELSRDKLTSTTSSDPSDISLEFCAIPKFKPKFLTRLNKHQKDNAFQDILEESNKEEDTLNKSQKMLSISQRNSSSHIEQDIFESKRVKDKSIRESRNSVRIQGQSNVNTVEKETEVSLTKTQEVPEVQNARLTLPQIYLSLHPEINSEPEELKSESRRRSRRFSSKVHGKSTSPVAEVTESFKVQDISKRQSGRESSSQKENSESEKTEGVLERDNRNSRAASRQISACIGEGDESRTKRNVSKRQSGPQSKSQKQDGKNLSVTSKRSVPRVVEGDAASSTQDISETQSNRQSKSQKHAHSGSSHETESDKTERILERDNRNLRVSARKSVSPLKEVDASPSIQNILRDRSGRHSRLQKRSRSRVMNESESEETEDILEQDNRNLIAASEKSASHGIEETGSLKAKKVLKRQTGPKTRSQRQSYTREAHDSESEKSEGTLERDSRNLRVSARKSVSLVKEVDASSSTQGVLRDRSGRQSRLQKRSRSRVMNESESEEMEDVLEQDNRNLIAASEKSASHGVEDIESLKPKEVLKRQTGRKTRSQRQSYMQEAHDSESEKSEGILERDSRNLRITARKSPSLIKEVDASSSTQGVLRDRSGRQSRLQKRSRSRVMNESESEEMEDVLEQDNRNLIAASEKSASHGVEDIESLKPKEVLKRQTGRKTRSQRQSYMQEAHDSESEKSEGILERDSRNLRITARKSPSLVKEVDASSSTQGVLRDRSGRQSRLQKRSRSRVMNESESEEMEDVLEQDNRNSIAASEKSASHGVEDIESLKPKEVLKRQTGRKTRSQRQSYMQEAHDSESEKSEGILERDSRNLRITARKSPSLVKEVDASSSTQGVLRDRSGRQSRLQKRSRSRVMNESESAEMEGVLEQDNRNLIAASEKSASHGIEEIESLKPKEVLKRQTGRKTRSQRQSYRQDAHDSDSEKSEGILERDGRNLRSTARKAAPFLKEVDVSSSTQGVLRDQSSRQSRLQKRSHSRIMNESESEEAEDTLKQDGGNLTAVSRKSASHAVEEIELVKAQDTSIVQSDVQTGSQRQSYRQDAHDSESEESEGILERDSRNLRATARKSASLLKEVDASSSTQGVLRDRSGRQSRLQKRSRLGSVSESEETEDALKQDDGNLTAVSRKSASHAVEEIESVKAQDASIGQSDRQTSSQRRLHLGIQSDETEHIFEQSDKNLNEVEEVLDDLGVPEIQDRSTESEKYLPTSVFFESEQDAVVNITKRKSRSLTIPTTRTASPKNVVIPITEEEGDRFKDGRSGKRRKSPSSNLEGQIRRFDEARESGSALSVMDQSDTEDVRSKTKRQKKHSRTARVEPAERIVREIESDKIEGNTSRQIDRSNEPETDVEAAVVNMNDNRIIPETQSFSMNPTDANIERMNKAGMQGIFDANISTNSKDRSVANVEDKRVNESEASAANELRKDTVENNRNMPKGVSSVSGLLPYSNIQRPMNSARKSLPSTSHSNTVKGQQSIMNFFNAATPVPASQVFSDEQQMEKLKRELERVKTFELVRMMKERSDDKMKSSARKVTKRPGKMPSAVQQKQRVKKEVHKAFLVNGQVYKVPRMPRPRYWITDRLYNYLWKCMEPKYNLATRVISEKFIQQLSNVTSIILKRKSYTSYKTELHALMKEMARLGIIRTRNDFYHFCQDFFPYELRVKMVPMLLPGNKRNIPYNMEKLNEPILDS